MRQGQKWPPIPADLSSGRDCAVETMQAVFAGVHVPPSMERRVRRLRDRTAPPSAFARFLDTLAILPALNVPRERAERLVVAVAHRIDAVYADETAPGPTLAMIEHEMALELEENVAAFHALSENTVVAHRRAILRLEAEMAAQRVRIAAHRRQIAALQRPV